MGELSVYYCHKCGYYAYFKLSKNAVCRHCDIPLTRLDMSHHDFTTLNHEARDCLITLKMVQSAPAVTNHITAPEALYQQRKLVGALIQQILELQEEVDTQDKTLTWMHATIWEELKKKQALKEEIRQLKAQLSSLSDKEA